jgi:hypothetical protein
MDTKAVWVASFSLAVAVLMFSMSGLGPALTNGTGPADELESGEKFEKEVDQNGSVSQGFGGEVNENSDSLTGLALGGVSAFFGWVGVLALLPLELNRLGLPYWAAYPLGLLFQAMIGIGLVQFAAGRILR